MPDSSERDKQGRLEGLTLRLRRCLAVLTASRRRDEVVSVVGEAASDQEAAEAVRDLLEVHPEDANAIVDMPVKTFTKERVARLEDETDRLQEKVATLTDDSESPRP